MKMTDQRKKEIADHFMEATNREELQTRDAARYLNLNPCYLSMVKTERHWSSMSQAAWDRLEEWHESRGKISEFVIPEGENIFIKPERKPALPEEGEAPANYPTGSAPAAKVTKKKGRKKKERPSIQLNALSAGVVSRFKELEDKIAELTLKNILLSKEMEACERKIAAMGDDINSNRDELFKYLGNAIEAVRHDLLKEADRLNGKTLRKGLVIFQRNYYKS